MSIQARRLSRCHPGAQGGGGPLVVSNVQYAAAGSQLTVTWNTNIPADSQASVYFAPAKHCTWDLQLGATTIDTSNGDQVYDFDAFDHSASEASGHYTIAYFSAGSWEDWRSDAGDFPAGVKGNNLDGWPGEKWLDVRQLGVLRPIMEARADLAKSKGYNAIDWDNVDGYLNSSGFPLTAADQTAYNKMLATIAHERGLAVFLKNCTNLVPTLEPYFDGGVVEQAYQYSEAAAYMAFSTAEKPLLEVEYSAQSASNQNDSNTRGYSMIYQTLALTGKYTASYVTNPPAPVVLTATGSPKSNATYVTTHSMAFTGLTPGQTYGFLIWSKTLTEKVYDETPRRFVAT